MYHIIEEISKLVSREKPLVSDRRYEGHFIRGYSPNSADPNTSAIGRSYGEDNDQEESEGLEHEHHQGRRNNRDDPGSNRTRSAGRKSTSPK